MQTQLNLIALFFLPLSRKLLVEFSVACRFVWQHLQILILLNSDHLSKWKKVCETSVKREPMARPAFVGKSSLILPLTRAETLKRRKKQAYHLPHVCPTPSTLQLEIML